MERPKERLNGEGDLLGSRVGDTLGYSAPALRRSSACGSAAGEKGVPSWARSRRSIRTIIHAHRRIDMQAYMKEGERRGESDCARASR